MTGRPAQSCNNMPRHLSGSIAHAVHLRMRFWRATKVCVDRLTVVIESEVPVDVAANERV